MDLAKAEQMAKQLMARYGLVDGDGPVSLVTLRYACSKDWRFEWSRSVSWVGRCWSTGSKKTITLSRPLVELNSEDVVRETILHEIAHALTPGHHHDATWREVVAAIGAQPVSCAEAKDIVRPARKYRAICPNCGKESFRDRLRKGTHSCGKCSGKDFDPKYVLRWEPNPNAS